MKDHLLNRLYLQDDTIQLSNLIYCDQLGNGNYGTVCLVKNNKNNYYYAIKGIHRNQIDIEELHDNLSLEKKILLQIDHPFIVKLVKTLKDNKYIFFLMEYVKGKELFDVIRDIGILNKSQTQFYAASMLLAIDYLHSRKFIYRDMKPENIMVNQQGFIKLIDFGTAKEIQDRTQTIIGTPHYMAPEIILGEGYSFQVDLWSIAICIFEFMCGGVPFGESAEEPMEIYLDIVNKQVEFPDFIRDTNFMNFILNMLNKNIVKRITKLSDIKAHPWFAGFNWDDLENLNVHPPYKPMIQRIKETNPISFVEYVKNNFQEYIPEGEDSKNISSKCKEEYDEWYNKF